MSLDMRKNVTDISINENANDQNRNYRDYR